MMGSNLCQRAVWLATAKGIMELVAIPARISIDQFATTRHGLPVNEANGNRNNYCLSTGDTYTFTVKLPFNDPSKYTVEWYHDPESYHDRILVPAWTNQTMLTLDQRGEYGIRFTSKCGETVDVGSFWLRLPNVTDIDFDYDPVIDILPGCSFTFRTKPGLVYKWKKDGEEIAGETKEFLIAREPGKYRLLVYDYCFNGYAESMPVELRQASIAQPQISRSSSKSLCFGETVTLSAPELPVGYSYKWFPGGETTNSIVVNKAGNYYVDLITSAGCPKRSATQVVVVNEELKLTPPAQVQICTITNQQLKLTAPEGFIKYTWDGASGTNNYLTVTAPGEYTLEVEDAAGCTASVSYIVVPYCPPPVPPNAFSPNGDGVNDTWTMRALETDPDAVVRIYNRLGEIVFKSSGTNLAWNGKYNGADLPPGTYYYLVTKTTLPKTVTGSITLIR